MVKSFSLVRAPVRTRRVRRTRILRVYLHLFSIEMGSLFSTPTDDLISTTLQSSQLIHRHTLSTCYDAIFDVSLSSNGNTILVSDDGRLRSFALDVQTGGQLTESATSAAKALAHEQIHDIVWSTQLDRFLVLTSKRLTTYDQANHLADLELGLPQSTRRKCFPCSWISFEFVFRQCTFLAYGVLVVASRCQPGPRHVHSLPRSTVLGITVIRAVDSDLYPFVTWLRQLRSPVIARPQSTIGSGRKRRAS